MNYNDKFIANYELDVSVPLSSENRRAVEYEHWALTNLIRMKYRITLCCVTVYFESEEDLLAFRLRFPT